jgi:hypothetical protein
MILFLSLPFLAALLALTPLQEASPPTQSVADAARAARERQKSSAPKHLLTDDDLASRRASGESALAGTETQAREQVEASIPPSPNAADLKKQIDQIDADGKVPAVALIARNKQTALYGNEDVDFPGRQEWEEQLESATTHFLDDAAAAVLQLQAIWDQNRDGLTRGDATTAQSVRRQWIDAVVPYASWQLRTQQLVVDGRSRAEGYKADSAAAWRDYRRTHAAQAESTLGATMAALQEAEAAFKKTNGRYTCDFSDFATNAASADKSQNSPEDWASRLEAVRRLGYTVLLQDCDADHYTALATPPAADGTQGRAFCTNESAAIRIGSDGKTDRCLSSGRDWHAQ